MTKRQRIFCFIFGHDWKSLDKPIRSVMIRENTVCKSVGVSGTSPVMVGKYRCQRCDKEMSK